VQQQASPVFTAVLVAAAGAVAVELVRERGRTSGDLALAVLFYGGIAGGVVLVGLSGRRNSATLTSYLFGALSTTSRRDLVVITALGGAVLATMLLLRPVLFAVCHDEEYARVSGLPVRALNLLLAVTTAVTVTIAMRAVGVLLISALMVIPVATAQQFTRGFRSTMYAAMALGVGAAGAGVWLCLRLGTAPGATIVVLAVGAFAVVAVAAGLVRAVRRRWGAAAPAPTEADRPDVLLHG